MVSWHYLFISDKVCFKQSLLHFVAFSGVASLFVIGVENKSGGRQQKSQVDNRKVLELTNGMIS